MITLKLFFELWGYQLLCFFLLYCMYLHCTLQWTVVNTWTSERYLGSNNHLITPLFCLEPFCIPSYLVKSYRACKMAQGNFTLFTNLPLLFKKSLCNLFPLHFPCAMFVIMFLLQEVFDMTFFFFIILNGAKQECCLLPQQNVFQTIHCWICHVCHFPSTVGMCLAVVCLFLYCLLFSIEFVLCVFSENVFPCTCHVCVM